MLRNLAGVDVGLTFVPHLLPMVRGIEATLYGRPPGGTDPGSDALEAALRRRYSGEPFVDVMPAGSHPETRSVRGVNQRSDGQ